MIVAGIGSRKGVEAAEVLALIERALGLAKIDRSQLSAVASAAAKAEEGGIAAAAQALNVPFRTVPHDELRWLGDRVNVSSASLRALDVASVSEAAALAVAGEGSTLLLARIQSERATCALACSSEPAKRDDR